MLLPSVTIKTAVDNMPTLEKLELFDNGACKFYRLTAKQKSLREIEPAVICAEPFNIALVSKSDGFIVSTVENGRGSTACVNAQTAKDWISKYSNEHLEAVIVSKTVLEMREEVVAFIKKEMCID